MWKFCLEMSWKQAISATILIAVLTTFAGLSFGDLDSGDETRVAGISAAMFDSGNLLLPELNGLPFLEYPPMFYWCQAASCKLFGVSDFAMRFPSAVFAFLGILAVFGFAGLLSFPPFAAFATTAFLVSCAQFLFAAHQSMVDMTLSVFVLLAVLAFYAGTRPGRTAPLLGGAMLCGFAIAGAVLTKGLIGAVLPGLVLGSWLLAGDILSRKIRWKLYFVLAGSGLLALALAGLWYFRLYQVYGWENYLEVALVRNNLGRLSGSQGDHIKPFWFYFSRIPVLFFPWILIVIAAMIFAWKRAWSRVDRDEGTLLLILFVIMPFLLFSISAGKREIYLLPIYAPCALLCGGLMMRAPEFFQRISARHAIFGRKKLIWIVEAVLVIVAVAPGIILFVMKSYWGVTSILAALLIIAAFAVHRSAIKFLSALLAFGLVMMSLDLIETAIVSRESLHPMFEKCKELERDGWQVCLIHERVPERTLGAASYYLRKRLILVPVNPGEMRPDPADVKRVYIVRDKSLRKNKMPPPETADWLPFGDHHYLFFVKAK